MPYASQISPNECHACRTPWLGPLYGLPWARAPHTPGLHVCGGGAADGRGACPRRPRSGAGPMGLGTTVALHGGGNTRETHREGERETTDDRESSLKRSSTIPIFTLQRGSQGPVV